MKHFCDILLLCFSSAPAVCCIGSGSGSSSSTQRPNVWSDSVRSNKCTGPVTMVPEAPTQRPNIHDLHHAARTNNVDDVERILSLGTADVNRTVCGATVLSLSLYHGNLDLFKLILLHPNTNSKLDMNKISKDEKTRIEPPLVTACRLENHEAVKLLIEAGVDLECTDNFNHSALWMATRQRFTDIVDYLIEKGANVNPSELWTHSPLFFAVKYSSKRSEIAKILIKHGASVKIEKGPSLLYCSIVQGMVPIAHLIVRAGYNVSKDDKLRQELRSGTLTRNQKLISWLQEEMSQPTSLQRQCRTVIRSHVARICKGSHFLQVLYSLVHVPLPKSVLAYLAMEDEIQIEVTWDLSSFGCQT